MSANLLAHTKDILWRKSLRVFGVVYFVLGLVDLIKTEFLPEKYQSWTFLKILHLQWRTWVIVLLFVLLILAIEGSNDFHGRVCTELETKLKDSREELERERAKYQKPILRGTIEQLYSQLSSPETLQGNVTCDAEVFLKVVIFNESPCSTTIRSFGLTFQDADGTHISKYLGEADRWVVELGNPQQDSFGGVTGSVHEKIIDLGESTRTDPIVMGVDRQGWLHFLVVGVSPKGVEKGLFQLTAVDSFGSKREIVSQVEPPLGKGKIYKYLRD